MKKRSLGLVIDMFLQILLFDYLIVIFFIALAITISVLGFNSIGMIVFYGLAWIISEFIGFFMFFMPIVFLNIFGIGLIFIIEYIRSNDANMLMQGFSLYTLAPIYILFFFLALRIFSKEGGRSIGKKIFKLIVVTPNDEKIDKKQALERNKSKWLVIWFWWAFLILSLTKRKNIFYDKETGLTYWDKKCGTRVITVDEFNEINGKKAISNEIDQVEKEPSE